MNKEIMKTVGFEKEVKAVENKQCPMCSKKIDISKFRDKLSLKEYEVGGLCQDCQDEIFGSDEKSL